MASNVDFGLWYDFRNPKPWQIDFEQFYSERLDQIARAETMGEAATTAAIATRTS